MSEKINRVGKLASRQRLKRVNPVSSEMRPVGDAFGELEYIRRQMTDLGSYPTLRQGPFLFDLSTDPNESYDVSASHPDVCAEMIEHMADWEAQIEINRRGWL